MSYSTINGGRAMSGLGITLSASASASTSGGASANTGSSDAQLVESTYGEKWCMDHGGMKARLDDRVQCNEPHCGCRGTQCACGSGYVPPPPPPPAPSTKSDTKVPCLTIAENKGKEPASLSAWYKLTHPGVTPIICNSKLLRDPALGPVARICNTSAAPEFCFMAKVYGKALLGRGTSADVQRWKNWPAQGIKAGQVPSNRPGGVVMPSSGSAGSGSSFSVFPKISLTQTSAPASPVTLTKLPTAPIKATIMSPPASGQPSSAVTPVSTTRSGIDPKILLIGGALVLGGVVFYVARKK